MRLLQKIYPYIALLLFPIFYVNRLFLENYLFYGEERGFLNYDFVNYRFNAIWESSKNFGGITANHLNVFTTGFFWKITTFLNLSWFQSESLFYYTIIFLTTFFAFLLFKKISKNPFLSLLLSFIYITTFNYYATISTTPKLFHDLIIPLSLFCWLMFIDTKQLRYFIGNTVSLVLLLGIGINPSQMIGAYSFIFFFIVIFNLSKTTMIYALFFYFPYVLNIALVLVLQTISIHYSGQIFSYNIFNESFEATSSLIHEILRFFGGWWDYEGSGELLYNHIGYIYHSFLGILTTYIPFSLFAFLAYDFKKNISIRNKLIIFAVIMLFLAKGAEAPFGELFNQAYAHFEILKIFREPWAKFIINFIFAIYLGIAYLLPESSAKIKKISYGLLGFLLIFQLVPLVLGQVIDHRNISWKVSDVNVPEYWQSVSEWSKKTTKNKRVLMLPAKIDTVGTLVQNWHPFYYIGYPDEFFVYGDLVNSQYNNKEDEYLTSNFLKHLNPASLSLASIDYVIVKNDLMTQKNEKLVGIEVIKDGIDEEKKMQYGGLDVYPVKKEYRTSRFRAVSFVQKGSKDCSKFYTTNGAKDLRSVAYIDSTVPTERIADTSQIEISRISSTEYAIKFSNNINGGAALFFAEAFNTGWQIYDSRGLLANPLQLNSTHFRANCFGNAWFLPKSLVKNYQTLYIRYYPQILFEKIKLIFYALFILIAFLLYLFIYKRKTKETLTLSDHPTNMQLPSWSFIGYRLFILYIPILLILFNFATPRSYNDIIAAGVSAGWLLSIIFYKIPSKIGIRLAALFLILTVLGRLVNFTVFAESMGIWTILFLLFTVIQSIFIDNQLRNEFNFNDEFTQDNNFLKKNSFTVLALPLNFINEIIIKIYVFLQRQYRVTIWNSSTTSVLLLKIAAPILVLVISLFIFRNIELEQYKYYLVPTITSIEPETVGKNEIITIKGNMFIHEENEKSIIRSAYGDLKPDMVTTSSITFRIPPTWKSGPTEIWIGRPTVFERQYVMFESEKRIIEVK